jgi:protein MpaA
LWKVAPRSTKGGPWIGDPIEPVARQAAQHSPSATIVSTNIHPMPAMPLIANPPEWNGEGWPSLAPVELGRSVLGNAVNLYHERRANLLAVGGVHGDESEGIFLAHLLMREGAVPVIPCLNPDGALLRQRWNARNVDLNRNLPTPDWSARATQPRYPPGPAPASEPETKAFLAALERSGATAVLSLHSYKESFLEIERAPETLPRELNAAVARFAEALGIERRQSIGYQTPGALGAYGRARRLLVLTYELRRGASHGELHAILPRLLDLVRALDAVPFREIPG